MTNNLFAAEDFEIIKKYVGQPKDNFAEGWKDPELQPLRDVYEKFKTLLYALRDTKKYRLNKNNSFAASIVAIGTAKKLDEYRWGRLYPEYVGDKDKVCFSAIINKDGLDWNITEFEGDQKSIRNRHLPVDEVCQMSLEDLVRDFKNYTDANKEEFLKFQAKIDKNS